MSTKEQDRSIAIGHRFRQARLLVGLKQTQLAKLISVTHQYISKIENGLVETPGREFIMRAAKEMNVSAAWLLYGDKELDDLPEDAIAFALEFTKLDKYDKQTISNLIRQMSKRNKATT